ncbi:MAG: 3-oxoacyl-[acyl-carrier-protein] reductase [Deltaproteobacteria bacterium]|jgi:3-oxoacyl-[acyl-carrier protein] reductase|nr:3-oxoacyl-[acyl-carrier-protein] reductase [Deltaproteobacteria bacterium]
MANKVVIITGGTRGIGKAIAMALADGNTLVLTHTNPNFTGDAALISELREKGAKEVIIKVWLVQDETASQNAVAEIIASYGRIDVLVNNAGITRDNLSLRLSKEDWDKVLEVNLFGAFLVSRLCAKHMLKARYGRIINLSSVVGFSGNPGQANYSASKAGLIGLTKTLALEYASRGVTVNAVAPGFISTDMTEKLSQEQKAAYLEKIPLKSFGSPDDVANAIAFLASDKASYITGQTLHVNGGLYL